MDVEMKCLKLNKGPQKKVSSKKKTRNTKKIQEIQLGAESSEVLSQDVGKNGSMLSYPKSPDRTSQPILRCHQKDIFGNSGNLPSRTEHFPVEDAQQVTGGRSNLGSSIQTAVKMLVVNHSNPIRRNLFDSFLSG